MAHNKKRNTAFLFEILSREATKAILNKDIKRAEFVKAVIVEHFNPHMELGKELKLYKALEKNSVEEKYADKYLQEVKYRHDRLNKKSIFNEQSAVINKINKHLGLSIYNNFIPNYKNIATISQIFNPNTPIKEKILLEQSIMLEIKSEETKEDLRPADNIIYKTFVGKFNEKYSGLLSEQKELLTQYVSSFSDGGLELKVYLNEELERLKEGMKKAINSEEVKSDKNMETKTKEVAKFLNDFKDVKDISKDMLEKILKIQQLVHEVNN